VRRRQQCAAGPFGSYAGRLRVVERATSSREHVDERKPAAGSEPSCQLRELGTISAVDGRPKASVPQRGSDRLGGPVGAMHEPNAFVRSRRRSPLSGSPSHLVPVMSRFCAVESGRLRSRNPVGRGFERVVGQDSTAAIVVRIERTPIHVDAGQVEPSQAEDDGTR
jgi:hypothetical protein